MTASLTHGYRCFCCRRMPSNTLIYPGKYVATVAKNVATLVKKRHYIITAIITIVIAVINK